MSNEEKEFDAALATTVELSILLGRLRSLRRNAEEEGAVNLAALNLGDMLDQSVKKCREVFKDSLEVKRAKISVQTSNINSHPDT